MAFVAVVGKAQTTVQTAKTFDNVYLGIEGGVSTPLTFDDLFPVNPMATLRLGKRFTPVWGAEVEGTSWFGSRSGYADRFDGTTHNAFRGLYVGVNGTTNLTNLFKGYNGTPRGFELSTVVGTGWIHTFTPNNADKYHNYLGAKTGLDFNFNFGRNKAHTIAFRPAVLWNLSQPGNSGGNLAFNKKGAELYLGLGYVYHFRTSNGTRHFKLYDVGGLNDEIGRLNAELAKKPKEVVREVVREVRVPEFLDNEIVVFFAKGSAELTDEAKAALNKVHGVVSIYGFASPDGPKSVNDALSNRRAQVVADYLVNLPNHIRINACEGKGVQGETSGRVTIVTVK
jgi:hypothetical protein